MPIVTPIPAENLLKTVIKGQFSTRPALRSVVAEMLARTLKEHYPPLSIAPSDLYMALPREGAAGHCGRCWMWRCNSLPTAIFPTFH